MAEDHPILTACETFVASFEAAANTFTRAVVDALSHLREDVREAMRPDRPHVASHPAGAEPAKE